MEIQSCAPSHLVIGEPSSLSRHHGGPVLCSFPVTSWSENHHLSSLSRHHGGPVLCFFPVTSWSESHHLPVDIMVVRSCAPSLSPRGWRTIISQSTSWRSCPVLLPCHLVVGEPPSPSRHHEGPVLCSFPVTSWSENHHHGTTTADGCWRKCFRSNQ